MRLGRLGGRNIGLRGGRCEGEGMELCGRVDGRGGGMERVEKVMIDDEAED